MVKANSGHHQGSSPFSDMKDWLGLLRKSLDLSASKSFYEVPTPSLLSRNVLSLNQDVPQNCLDLRG